MCGVRPGDLDAGGLSELVQAAGGHVPVHPGSAAVGQDRPAGAVASRAADASDLEIHDTVLIAAVFCMYNRYVDGLATIAPDDPALYAAGAQRLINDGYLPPPGEPSHQN
jgi:hypothetical protein